MIAATKDLVSEGKTMSMDTIIKFRQIWCLFMMSLM